MPEDSREELIKADFVYIPVRRDTRSKIRIMAPVLRRYMHDLVREWADDAWEDLVQAGLVNEEALAPLPAPLPSASPHLEEHKMGGGGKNE